jgi:hypothetical protein
MTMTETITNRTGILKLWLLNFVANAAVLVVWYFWLQIPDAHGWQVFASGLIAITMVLLVVWLRAGTLSWFRIAEFRRRETVWDAYRHSVRFVLALGFWAIAFFVLAWLIWSLREYVPQFAVWMRQNFPEGPTVRKITDDANLTLLLLIAYVMPVLWMPIATTVAASGVHPVHLARSRRVWKRGLYWLWMALLLGAGLYIPYRLIWWIPEVQTLRQQAWSMGGRFLLAYLIAVTAYICAVWLTGVYTDREDPLTP